MPHAKPYRTSDDVVSTDVGGGEAVLLHLETQEYYALNETGTRLWEWLTSGDAPLAADTLAARLADAWDLAPDTAREHVDAFLKEMTANDLVEPVENEST